MHLSYFVWPQLYMYVMSFVMIYKFTGYCTYYSGNRILPNFRTSCKKFVMNPCPDFYRSTEAYKCKLQFELSFLVHGFQTQFSLHIYLFIYIIWVEWILIRKGISVATCNNPLILSFSLAEKNIYNIQELHKNMTNDKTY